MYFMMEADTPVSLFYLPGVPFLYNLHPVLQFPLVKPNLHICSCNSYIKPEFYLEKITTPPPRCLNHCNSSWCVSLYCIKYNAFSDNMQDLNKQVRTPPQASGRVVGLFYESFLPGFGIAGWRRRYCGFDFAGRSRISFSPSPPEDVGSISFSRKVFAGTEDSAGCIGPARWPAAAECLTR